MQERYLGRIEPDMDVCDIDGQKIGSVAHVYRYDLAAIASEAVASVPPALDEILEVKTGFLGLGKHLFVPMSAIQEVTQGCVFLSKPRDEIDREGWDTKPPHLDELR